MALATRISLAVLAAYVLLTALGGTLQNFRILLVLHCGLIGLFLLFGEKPGAAGRVLLPDGLPLLIFIPLFWSHRHVWFPLAMRGSDGFFRILDRVFRGPALETASREILAEGNWGAAWLFWFLPVAGFYALVFLVWARARRESFLALRDGAVTAFHLACFSAMMLPLRGALSGLSPEGLDATGLGWRTLSAWDGQSPASVLVTVLWASWKSTRGYSLFLSKFFLGLGVLTTAVLAFSPAHHALSAFLSPALGLGAAALSNRMNRGASERT